MTAAYDVNKMHQEDLQRLKKFRLFDDDFFTKCLEDDTASIQLILRTVMQRDDLLVKEVHTQVFVENLLHRSIRLDVMAIDAKGRVINIEIQRDDRGALSKRARYHSSMIDTHVLKKSDDFQTLPETYVIFITEHDYFGEGLPVYHVERCILETNKRFVDGTHILYVNGAYRGNDAIGKLMHDFACTDPSKMHYEELAKRVRYFKESKEGMSNMCEMLEEMRNESLQQGRKEGRKQGRKQGMKKGIKKGRKQGKNEGKLEEKQATAQRMLSKGKYSLEEIADILELSMEELKKLNKKRLIKV